MKMLVSLREQFGKRLQWKNMKRWLLQLLVLAIVIGGVRFYQHRDLPKAEMPAIAGQLLSGEQVSLAQYRGKPLLVHFWATWCPVCEMEASTLVDISQDYAVLSVAVWSGSEGEVRDYLQARSLRFPVIVDHNNELAARFSLQAVPSSFFVDAEGVIQFIETGYTTAPGFRWRLSVLENLW